MIKETVFKPFLQEDDYQAITDSLKLGWLSQGSDTKKFEDAVKEYAQLHDRYVVGVSTGYAALHLALVIAGIKDGDEVITPSLNNIADFQAIENSGAIPVFCDIKDDTLCIDLDKAEKLITHKTKALIFIDYASWQPSYKAIKEFGEKHNLIIIHDAAHSFGWKQNNLYTGNFFDYTMFSFDPVKTITCIDGGILVLKDKEKAQLAQELRIMGMGQPAEINYQNKRAWSYDVKHKGYRYHLANSHAALGFNQLQKIDSIAQKRKQLFITYSQALADCKDMIIPQTDLNDIIPLLYVVRVQSSIRDQFRKELHEQGIETGLHWTPGHKFSYFKHYNHANLKVTNNVFDTFLSLPFHPTVNLETPSRIASIYKKLTHNPFYISHEVERQPIL